MAILHLRIRSVGALTSINDLAKEILPPEEILRRAIPSSIAKLVLTLDDSLIRAPGHCQQHPRILSSQAPLFSPESPVKRGLHV